MGAFDFGKGRGRKKKSGNGDEADLDVKQAELCRLETFQYSLEVAKLSCVSGEKCHTHNL